MRVSILQPDPSITLMLCAPANKWLKTEESWAGPESIEYNIGVVGSETSNLIEPYSEIHEGWSNSRLLMIGLISSIIIEDENIQPSESIATKL